MEEVYDDMLIELECPVCLLYMYAPIILCKNGHSICSSCRKELEACAMCKQEFTDSRNFSLEKMAEKMLSDCKNNKYGCKVKIPLSKKQEHERQCTIGKAKCEECNWRGEIEELEDHWKTIYNLHLNKTTFTADFTKKHYLFSLHKHNNKMFWRKTQLANDNLYVVMQIINKDVSPADYRFEIEIVDTNLKMRKIVFSEYCSELQEGFDEDMFKSPKSIVICKANWERYVGVNNKFNYTVKIETVNNNNIN